MDNRKNTAVQQNGFIKPRYGLYAKYVKRYLDVFVSLMGLVVLSPIFLLLIVIGAVEMKGNPFFMQQRPGKDEKIFNLIKFRTMTNKKDKDGKLLPDEQRLTAYGKFLRSTSLDELPELWNILKGDLSLIGPRPLLVKYLPFYTEQEHKRHIVRPGLTGLAQISGRNELDWDTRLSMDVKYVENITFLGDLKIFFQTVVKVIRRENIVDAGSFEMLDLDQERGEEHANFKN